MSTPIFAISRDNLPGDQDDLVLNGTGPYIIGEDGFTQPSRLPVVTVETNMFLDGALPTGLRLDVAEFVLRVIVLGNSRDQLHNRINNLMEAVTDQLIYTVTVTINQGTPHIWNAYAGPVTIDNSGRNAALEMCAGRHFEQLIVTIPVQPRSS